MHKLFSILIGFSLFVPVTVALATETPSLDLGKSLFESVELGTRQQSCSSCHPDGKGLDQVGDFSDAELKDLINACIRDALGGALLNTDSQEINALLGYIRLFQKN